MNSRRSKETKKKVPSFPMGGKCTKEKSNNLLMVMVMIFLKGVCVCAGVERRCNPTSVDGRPDRTRIH